MKKGRPVGYYHSLRTHALNLLVLFCEYCCQRFPPQPLGLLHVRRMLLMLYLYHSPFISFSQGCTIGCTQCNATGVPVGPGFPNNDTGTYSSPNIGTFGYDIGGPDLCPNDHSKSKVSWSKSCFVVQVLLLGLQSCSQTSLT